MLFADAIDGSQITPFLDISAIFKKTNLKIDQELLTSSEQAEVELL